MAVCLVVLSSPAVSAQTAGAADGVEADAATVRPFDVLLESRDELVLTDLQHERLRALRDQLALDNEPLVRRLLRLRAEWRREARLAARDAGADVRSRERVRNAVAAIRLRIQRNNRRAMREVSTVLTPEQRAGLRALVEARRLRRTPSAGAADAGPSD